MRLLAGAVALCLFGMANSASAAPRAGAIVDVQIKNFVYAPRVVTIDPGDAIRWTNFDTASHGQVSVEPGFSTVVLGQDQSTLTTFNVPGTFAYVCSIHGVSMQGTVVVRGTPPEKTAAPLIGGSRYSDRSSSSRSSICRS